MTPSDKQKATSKRPNLRIVHSSSTDAQESPQGEASSSSDSTTSSTSTEATSEPQATSSLTQAERQEFLDELQEYMDVIMKAAKDNKITGIAFVTINEDEATSGTAYTTTCEFASHLTIAGIETLRYRFMRNLMEDE